MEKLKLQTVYTELREVSNAWDQDSIPAVIILTPEELKSLLQEYTNRIANNAQTKCLNQQYCSECEYHIINKESITSQLEPFMEELL